MDTGCADGQYRRLYDLLGVCPDATPAKLRCAYFAKARQHHPDRAHLNNQCPKAANAVFREIKYAYESLIDPALRSAYDRGGDEALRRAAGVDPEKCPSNACADMFAAAAAQAGIFVDGDCRAGAPGAQRRRKGPTLRHDMAVSLEELFNGRTTQIAVERTVLLGDKKAQRCAPCAGCGFVVQRRLVGFGAEQDVRSTCPACKGRGSIFAMERTRALLSVCIEPGMYPGDHVVLRGAADETDPDVEPGDIVITVREKPHPQFQRRGDDLLMDVRITLGEALCGFEIPVRHLDGRKLLITNAPGEIIRPGSMKAVPDAGMPVRRRCDRGQLILRFDVVFPPDNYICERVRTKLRESLPGCPKLMGARCTGPEDEFAETVVCSSVDKNDVGRANGKRSDPCYESDDEDRAEERCGKMMNTCTPQ